MLEFKSITIENFLSHKETHIDLFSKNLTLILGENEDTGYSSSNGSGKSTIFEALYWCLYGKTSRGSRSEEIGSRFKTEDDLCRVQVDFDFQGESYSYVRGRAKSKPFFTVFEGREMRSDFELPISSGLFLSTIYFPQDRFQTFANSTDSFRKKILTEILRLEKFQTYQDIAKELAQTLDKEITEIDFTIARCCGAKEVLENKISANRENLLVSVDEIQEEIDEKKRKFIAERLELVRQRTKIESDLVFLGRKLKPKLRERLRAEFETFLTGIKSLENQIERGEASLEQLKAECPLCKQSVSTNQKKKLYKLLPYDELAKKQSQRTKFQKEIAKTEGIHFGVVSDIEKLEKEKEEIEKELRNLKTRISSTQETFTKTMELLEKAESGIEELEEELAKTNETIEEKESEKLLLKKQLQLVEFWITNFGAKGIVSFLIDQSLPFLNEKGREYLSYLAPEIILGFDTKRIIKSGDQRESFSIFIEEDDRRYFSLSGGERKRIDLAILLALASYTRQFCPVSLMFLDEIFSGLDEIGCDGVLELLKAEKENSQNSVFVISHLEELKDSAIWDQILMVRKKNGISVVEEI